MPISVTEKISRLFNFIGELYTMTPQYELKFVEDKVPFIFNLGSEELNRLSKDCYIWKPENGDNEGENDVIFGLTKPNLPAVPVDLQDYIQIKHNKIIELLDNIPEKIKNEIKKLFY